MSNTAPSRADPVVVFPFGRWCPPQETSQPHPPQNVNRNATIFIEENAPENVVCEMASILSLPQCVKSCWLHCDNSIACFTLLDIHIIHEASYVWQRSGNWQPSEFCVWPISGSQQTLTFLLLIMGASAHRDKMLCHYAGELLIYAHWHTSSWWILMPWCRTITAPGHH